MRKIAVVTSKGGTGKTTTAINLSYGLAMFGQRVLLIDCDPQRNLAIIFDTYGSQTLPDLLLRGKVDILQVRKNLFFIDSGGRKLAETESLLAQRKGGELRLRQVLSTLKGSDWVICDCPPSTNLININVLTYADYAIIPVSMDFLGMVGVKKTMETIVEVDERLGHQLRILGILATFFDSRTKVSYEVLQTLRQHFKKKVFNTVIRTNTSLKEAPGFHKVIFEYAPYSYGSQDYYLLTEEVFNYGWEEKGGD